MCEWIETEMTKLHAALRSYAHTALLYYYSGVPGDAAYYLGLMWKFREKT